MKLTKTIRERILRDAKNGTFRLREEEADKAMADAVVKYLDKNNVPRADTIPDGFAPYIRTTNSASIYIAYKQNICVTLPVQFCSKPYGSDSLDMNDFKDTSEFKEIMSIRSEKEEFETALKSILNSCTTDNQLIETAPELSKYIPPLEVAGQALVAVETVNRVRAILGGNHV